MTGQARRDNWRQRLAERPARMAVGLWMVFLLACAAVVCAHQLHGGLVCFPAAQPERAEQQLLVDQLRRGAGVQADPAWHRRRRRRPGGPLLSRAVAAKLRADRALFLGQQWRAGSIQASDPALPLCASLPAQPHGHAQSAFRRTGSRRRWAKASTCSPLRRTLHQNALAARSHRRNHLRAGPSSISSQRVPLRDGAWSSRNGQRAVLLAQTASAGSDTDGQADAIAAIRQAFGQARQAQPAQAGAAPYRLVMTGPGVFSVSTRDTIKREVERLSTLGICLIVTLLLVVYRSTAHATARAGAGR
ncbi:MMPL family transporter [Cupriavidus basilensis]